MSAAATIQGLVVSQMQGNNILLFLALIVLFVIAYRVLRAVIHTAIVAVLSGGFLVGMDYIGLGPAVTLDRFMLFMVLGTALFIGYSMFFTVLRTTSSLVGVGKKLGGLLTMPFGSEDETPKEKEIVLDELQAD
jgi:hypothetical protein